MTNPAIESQVRARLAESGVRYTGGRQRVVAALAAADGPRSAAELHDEMDAAVPVSTLYRSLAVMAEAEVLAQHHGSKGLTRYELAEWLAGHHHHLVCVDCGTVDDIELPAALESTLDDVVTTVARSGQFEAVGHALEVAGRCRQCA